MLVNIDLIKNPLNWLTVILMLLIAFIILNLALKCKSHYLNKPEQD